MKKRIIALLLCAAVILSSGCTASNDSLPDNTSEEYTSSESGTDTTDTSGGTSDDSSQQTQTDADSTTLSDGTSAPKPTETTESKTESSSDKPASSSDKPASSSDKPASSTDKPASSTDKPASSTSKPTSSTSKPASSTSKPASSSSSKQTTTTTKQTTTTTTTKQTTSDTPQSYSQSFEAENGSYSSDMSVISNTSASGSKTVGKFENNASYWQIEISIPSTAVYDIVIRSSGIDDNKENNLLIDGTTIGSFSSTKDSLQDYTVSSVNISKGNHTLKITKSWGWIELDRITVKSAETIADSTYNVTSSLVNGHSTVETKKLYQFLKDSYGNYVIAGQQCDGGINGTEFKAIKAVTGKYPALIGLDMMNYTPSRTALGTSSTAVEKAIEFSDKGGIVTFCWHWNSPTDYLKDGKDPDNGNPRWWGGFYSRNTNFDIAKVMNGQDEKGKKLLDADIKEIAAQLKRLENAGVPVLWRPLHEGSGGWFWWGAKGADAYKKLWRYLYTQLTDVYKCNNLIWVYNGQSADWYPGDEYVDIVGEDIYPGKRVYNPQTSRFRQAVAYGSKNKITALTENGCIFDIDQAVGVNCMWSWFCTWGGEFAVNGSSYSEKYTEKSILKKAYQSKYVLTLDELPNIY